MALANFLQVAARIGEPVPLELTTRIAQQGCGRKMLRPQRFPSVVLHSVWNLSGHLHE